MSVIEAMALAYLDALAPGGFRDAEEREAAALQRIGPMRAALAEARKHGWQLVPVEPTEKMLVKGADVEIERYDCSHFMWGGEAQMVYRAMLAAAPSVEDNT